jgi:hypothetical protein
MKNNDRCHRRDDEHEVHDSAGRGMRALVRRHWRSLAVGVLGLTGAVGLSLFLLDRGPFTEWLAFDLARFWFWALVFSVACLFSGLALLRRLSPDPERPALVTVTLALPLGLVIFVMGMYLGGFLGLYGPVFAVLLPAALVTGASLLEHRGIFATLATLDANATWPLSGRIVAIFGTIAAALVYLAILSPDSVCYDAAWVHLTIAQDYAREGRVVPFVGDWVKSVPHLASMVYTWGFLVPGMGKDVLRWMLALHLEFAIFLWTLVGIAAGVQALAGRAVRNGWVFLFMFPGLFVHDSTLGASADHILASFAVPFLMALLEATRRFARGPCLVAGLLMGGAFLTKWQAFYLAIPAVLFASSRLTFLLLRRRSTPAEPGETSIAPVPPRRQMVGNFLLAGLAALLVMSPHLGKNLAAHRNPVYPLAQDVFESRPRVMRDAALHVKHLMAEWVHKPPAALKPRVVEATKLLGTFAFVPHYNFYGGVPIFGFLFTLCFPFLFFVGGFRKARGLWVGALLGLGALACWAMTYWVDRNLQTFLPLLAVVTGGLLVRAWDLGWLARVGAGALVVVQLAWGADFYASASERISPAVGVLRAGLEGRKAQRWDNHWMMYNLAVGAALPPNAVVMLHDVHTSLGISRRVYLDWLGYQGVIDYRRFNTPRDMWQRLRQLGITHVVWQPSRTAAMATKQEEVIFSSFVNWLGDQGQTLGHYRVAAVPPDPPAKEKPYQVLVAGINGYADGVYPIEDLDTIETYPPDLLRWAPPIGLFAGKDDLARVNAAILGTDRNLGDEASAALARDFFHARSAPGFTVWVRPQARTAASGSASPGPIDPP